MKLQKILKTINGNPVNVMINDFDKEIRFEFSHPQLGKVISYGSHYKKLNGMDGISTHSGSRNIFLTIPKEDLQPFLNIIAEREKAEKAEMEAEYQKLIEKLPPIPKFENTPDPEKFQSLMSKLSKQYFSGEEDDGLNLSVDSYNSKILSEARKFCKHELQIEYNKTYTEDARKKVERVISCDKCGLYVFDTAEEGLSDSAIWR